MAVLFLCLADRSSRALFTFCAKLRRLGSGCSSWALSCWSAGAGRLVIGTTAPRCKLCDLLVRLCTSLEWLAGVLPGLVGGATPPMECWAAVGAGCLAWGAGGV